MSTNKDILKKKITENLEAIVEQTRIINAYPGIIPQIELDIVLANIRELYEDYHTLSKLIDGILPVKTEDEPAIHENSAVIKEDVIPATETSKKPEPPREQPATEEETIAPVQPVEPAPVKEYVKFRFEPPAPDEELSPVAELKAEPEVERKKESELHAEKPQKKQTPRAVSSLDLFGAQTIADKYRDEKQSLNEQINKEKDDKSLASKLLLKPIKDLKSAIGINDKFKFMNELFEGNMNEYNQAVDALNNFSSELEAMECLDSLFLVYKWKSDSDAYTEFRNYVIRRYIKTE